ncbi:hypothetical protein LAZ67_2003762 [Cordylochernes scorpioides]|uniref:DUF4371 domain-containing protein n=1 Tax=Cordylochernes scorpioides TaxID=51811 RepID=A0ABY6K376_9ARAC|nr:hypothetical protein LAZ67_2003762 [Cordylochernes scorpioides]
MQNSTDTRSKYANTQHSSPPSNIPRCSLGLWHGTGTATAAVPGFKSGVVSSPGKSVTFNSSSVPAFKEDALSQSRTYEWFSRFKAGRTSVKEDLHTGRSLSLRNSENALKIKSLIKKNPRITIRMLSKDLDISFGTSQTIIKNDLPLKRSPAKFGPHLLTNKQKENRKETCKSMVELFNSDPHWLKNVTTGDETWVYRYDIKTKRQSSLWLEPGEPRFKKARMIKSNLKCLLITFFDVKQACLMRQEKLKEFKLGMKKQQFMFTKVSQESEAAVHASYVLSEMIAKQSKPFTEGDFIKECLIKAAEIVCPGREDIFNCVYDLLQKYNLPQSKLTSVATDGASSMTGKTNGFVALLRKKLSEISDGSNIHHTDRHHTHCIRKYYVRRSRGLNQRQFSLFLTELESEYSGLSYYTEVCWLSCSKVLKQFWDLKEEIYQFLITKNQDITLFSDQVWLQDFSFMVDITKHLSDLNLKLQGKDQIITNMCDQINAFKCKLVSYLGKAVEKRRFNAPSDMQHVQIKFR